MFSTPGGDHRAFSPDSFASFLRRLVREVNAFSSSPRWARWGGVSLVVAGVVGLLTFLLDVFVVRCELFTGQQVYGCGGGFQSLSYALRAAETLLFASGILGLYALSSEPSKSIKRLARAGAVLVVLFVALRVGLAAHERYVWSFYVNYTNFSSTARPLGGIQLLAMTFVCVSALWSRGLGVWRWLPMGVLFLVAFFPQIIWSAPRLTMLDPDEVFFVNGLLMTNGTMPGTVVLQTPQIIAGLCWILLGSVMFGAKERETRAISKKRRETEKRNLARARRIYEEAWRDADLSVVNEIAAEDFFDKRRNRCGASALKQAISDLHHAFPNLEVEIETRIAEGDSVFTRAVFSGTDEGGVLYFPPTGRTAKFCGVFTDRYRDGKLIEHDGEIDERSLMEQLGHRSGQPL